MRLIAIIPALNEEKTIGEVISKLKNQVDEIIVIDDGSDDQTSKIAEEAGAKVYRHPINRGLGGALGTGLKAALLNEADIMVTLDADCQHDPAEIPKLIKPVLSGEADVVIGSRFLQKQSMPLFRRMGIPFFNLITLILFGIYSTDSQSGMRAFNKKAAENLDIYSRGILEASPEILGQIQVKGLRMKEVPTRSIYTEYSLSKGQRFSPGLKAIVKLLIFKLGK